MLVPTLIFLFPFNFFSGELYKNEDEDDEDDDDDKTDGEDN